MMSTEVLIYSGCLTQSCTCWSDGNQSSSLSLETSTDWSKNLPRSHTDTSGIRTLLSFVTFHNYTALI